MCINKYTHSLFISLFEAARSDNITIRRYSIMAALTIEGIGGIEILNGTPGVGSINIRAVCKMIILLLAGDIGRNDVTCVVVPVVRVYIT